MLRQIHSLLLLSVFFLWSPLSAVANPLTANAKGLPFIAGDAPILLSGGTTKEIKKNGKVFYKIKFVAKRATGDRGGKMVLVSKKGTVLEDLMGFFLPKSPLNRIPTLKMKFNYDISIVGKGLANKASRRAKGKKKFIQPVQFGMEPGSYTVIIGACGELDKHPLTTVVSAHSLFSFLAGLPTLFTPAGITKKAFEAGLKNFALCGNTVYTLDVLAKVPKVKGLSISKAKKALEDRNLGHVELTADNCKPKDIGKVIRQGVPPGKRRRAGSLISLRVCAEPTVVEPLVNFTGFWNTNLGPANFSQGTDASFEGSFGNGGTLSGAVVEKTASGRWREGDNSGRFSITMTTGDSKSNGAWSGSCSGRWFSQ